MSNELRNYLVAAGVGELRQFAELGETEKLSGGKAHWHLCLTDSGLCLAVANSAGQGQHVPIDLPGGLRYASRRLGDAVEVGGKSYALPRQSAAAARQVILAAQLGPITNQSAYDSPPGPLVETIDSPQRWWLGVNLEPDEPVLAWLPTGIELSVTSAITDPSEVRACYLLTDRRSALLAVTDLGDARLDDLGDTPLALSKSLGRTHISIGASRWAVSSSSGSRFAGLAAVPPLACDARIREVARQCWLLHDSPDDAPPETAAESEVRDAGSRFGGVLKSVRNVASAASAGLSSGEGETGAEAAARLLGLLDQRGTATAVDGLALLVVRMWLARFESGVDAAVSTDEHVLAIAKYVAGMARDGVDPEAAASWYGDWSIPSAIGQAVMARVIDTDDVAVLRWAVRLHEAIRIHLGEEGVPAERAARADLQLATHMLAAGMHSEAAQLLHALLSQLPDEHIEDLLPPEDADLTRGEGGQGLRIMTLELLAAAEVHDPGTVGSTALADLARLQPLVPERLTAVIETAPPALAKRAQEAQRILDPGGLDVTEAAMVLGSVVPLNAASIELLRHPAARKGSMADLVMSLLAESEAPPEQGQLRAYSERITADALPSVSNAVSDTVMALGMPSVEIYRSRGERSIGIRSFDGTPCYIVVGDEHLNAKSPSAMDDAALRFALAAELAHIRFGHTRMTSNDVRRGVWGKSRAAAGFAAGFLVGPMVN